MTSDDPPLRVALVTMPFASCDRPSLGLGLLKAGVRRLGVACEVKHFNMTFWSMLGHDRYHALSQLMPNTALAGEWIFAQVYWRARARLDPGSPTPRSDWRSYDAEILDDPIWGIDEGQRAVIREALDLAPAFLRLAYESNDWSRFDLVGFTSTFEQTMASFCLAQMIRAAHPEVRLAFGGANFEAGMGAAYLANFEFIDYVSIGEADRSFPALCQRLAAAKREGGSPEAIDLPAGILGRGDLTGAGAGAVSGAGTRMPIVAQAPAQRRAPEIVRDLDALPTPDYSEYFAIAAAHADKRPRPGHPARPWLAMETSRGCWWGAKNHCTFCGLNGETMGFRRKGAARVLAEIAELEARHGRRPIQFADNILGHAFFDELIPAWAAEPEPVRKFFEVKANLRRAQVGALARAGVLQIQPGIESLDDGTLVEMRKGVSAAQNVALLRWASEVGVRAYWNVLYGFPREPADSYARQLELFPKLSHLPPPTGCSLIRLDRFSPNFDAWREHGFTRLTPLPVYRHLFPFAAPTLAELAYFFRYEHPNLEAALRGGRALGRHIRRWREAHAAGATGRLAVEVHEGRARLVDERPLLRAQGRPPRTLAPVELALVLACDRPRRSQAALEQVAELGADAAAGALARLCDDAVIVELGGLLVTAAFLPPEEALADLGVVARGAVPPWLRRAR